MNPYSFPQVEEFRKQVKRFAGLWRSLQVRTAWTSVLDKDIALFTFVTLETKERSKLTPPKYDPTVEDFTTAWETKPIEEFDSLLDDLKRGEIRIKDRTINVAQFEGTIEQPVFSKNLNFSFKTGIHRQHSEVDPMALPRLSLEMNAGSVDDLTLNQVRLENLTDRWNLLSKPFEDAPDVLREYFGVDRPQFSSSNCFCHILARIPIVFDGVQIVEPRRMTIGISIPDTAEIPKVTVGRVLKSAKGSTRADRRLGRWKKVKDKRQYRLVEQLRGVLGYSVYLKYCGVILDKLRANFLDRQRQSPLLLTHECFDPGFAVFDSALEGGANPRDSRSFENAVGLLLAFCGFIPANYAAVSGHPGGEVDHIAYSPTHKVLLAVECTIELPNNKDKLSKLYRRCEDLRSKAKKYTVLAAVATRLTATHIPAPELEIAAKTEVAILTIESLKSLMAMARDGRTPGEMLNFILECIPDHAATSSSVLGNFKKSQRPRFTKQ